jgi:hypothetical protein
MPDSQFVMRAGRPVLLFHGEPMPMAMYLDPPRRYEPPWEDAIEQWLERHRAFRDSGWHNYALCVAYRLGGDYGTSRFWQGDGVYPEVSPDDPVFCVDRQAAALLEMDPEARLLVRFLDMVPKRWMDANPGELARSSRGDLPWFHVAHRASLASAKGLRDLATFFTRLLTYCESQPWADRLFGYQYFPVGEGIHPLHFGENMFDISAPMQEAFRNWVHRRYPDEAALREAWADDEVTFATVRVPTDEEWRQERSAIEWYGDAPPPHARDCERATDRINHWTEGNQLRRYRDYWALQRELLLHWYRTLIHTAREALGGRVPFGFDMAKQPMLGWQHNMSFGGYGPGADSIDLFAASGNVDLGELLDDPELDYLWTPADYTARSVGFGWEAEGAADSLHLRGKTILIENDSRTYLAPGRHTEGAFRNLRALQAGLFRNSAWSLTRGHWDYLLNISGGYYHDPQVHAEVIRPLGRMLNAACRWPHVETEHAIAMIIDDSAPWDENGTSGFANQAVLWQRVLGLAHCGVPYRVYLLSDLEKDNMPPYRAYLFPNLARVDDDRLALLQRQVFTDGRISIFGPATGLTDGSRLSADGASRLLGVEMELVRQHAPHRVLVGGEHPIVDALPSCLTYGDSSHYGPLLIPAEGALEAAGAVELGIASLYWSINRPGLFLRETDTHRVAWSAAVPLPAALLRELARSGDCHIWCEEDDVIFASETVAALHSVRRGPRTLRLPTPRPVWDLVSGEKLGAGLTEIPLYLTPPETRVFYFGDSSPF